MKFCGLLLTSRKTMFGLALLIGGALAVDSAHAQWVSSPQSFPRGTGGFTYPAYRAIPTGTGVFVNGRQLSWHHVQQLQRQFGYVRRGSYWLMRDGTYGFAGGPAMGNLFRPNRSYGATRRRPSLLSGGFLTGGGTFGGGAIFRGGGVTFGSGGSTYSR